MQSNLQIGLASPNRLVCRFLLAPHQRSPTHPWSYFPPEFSPYPRSRSKQMCFVLAGSHTQDQWAQGRRNLSKSALDKSCGLRGSLSCVRASDATTPELASPEGIWPIRGWAPIFRLGTREPSKTFSESGRCFGPRDGPTCARTCWALFSVSPKIHTKFQPAPWQLNPYAKFPNLVFGDFSGCSTLRNVCRKNWQAIRLSVPT